MQSKKTLPSKYLQSTDYADPVSLWQVMDASAESYWKMAVTSSLKSVLKMKLLANLADDASDGWRLCAVCPVEYSVPIHL